MAAGKTGRALAQPPKKDDKPALVAPDGGWGWLVVTAFALNFATVIPIMQNFGLLFGDEFRRLNFNDTAVSVLINVNYSVGVCIGLFNGPILRTFSFRKVAICGSLAVFVGMVLTSFADTFWQFLIYYGILLAIGCGLSMAAFSFAVNSYFKKRRGMAMGIAMTATGLGPVVMPHIIGLGVNEYGAKGTSLLMAGLSLHSLVGAMLLQPVEWHMKPAPVDEEKQAKHEDLHNHRISTVLENPEEQEAMLPKVANGHHKLEHHSSMASVRSRSGSVNRADGEPGRLRAYPWWNSGTSLDTVDLGNTLRAATEEESHCVMGADDKAECKEKAKELEQQDQLPEVLTLMKPDPNPPAPLPPPQEPEPEKEPKAGIFRACFRGFVRFFDLDLLRDPIYVNLMLGMSFAVFAEVNFSLLMPFILKSRNLTTKETATMLSLIATADIIFRFLAPFIGKAVKLPSRVMYAISLCLLVASRTTFVFAGTFTTMLSVMIFLGMAKGIRTVFWVLVIPDYVPLERLPAASGIQSVTNGLISVALGPMLGIIKDAMGSYDPIILVINAITMLTVTMWTVEMLIRRVKRKNRLRRLAEAEAEDSAKPTRDGATTVQTPITDKV